MTAHKPIISIIIPVWNEEETIGPLFQRLQQLSRDSTHLFDFIFVNDGSMIEPRRSFLRSCQVTALARD